MNLLERYIPQQEFDSYADFMANFQINPPENFNFGYDVVDYYAENCPEKIAIVWCDDFDNQKVVNFKELKYWSDKTAKMLQQNGIGKGDAVMLMLKSRYEFWYTIIALHKLGAIGIPATHMLTTKDIKYRVEEADIKMIISVEDNDLPQFTDDAHLEYGHILETKMLLSGEREGWLSFYDELDKVDENFERPSGEDATKNEDLMLIYFSSGTTGFPNMVKLSFCIHWVILLRQNFGNVLEMMNCITRFRIQVGQSVYGENYMVNGWQELVFLFMIMRCLMQKICWIKLLSITLPRFVHHPRYIDF